MKNTLAILLVTLVTGCSSTVTGSGEPLVKGESDSGPAPVLPTVTQDSPDSGSQVSPPDAGPDSSGDSSPPPLACSAGSECVKGECETRGFLSLPDDNSSWANAPTPTLADEHDVTVEMWVRQAGDGVIATVGTDQSHVIRLKCFTAGDGTQGWLEARETSDTASAYAEALVGCGDDKWHHVADVRHVNVGNGAFGLEHHLFWDGQPVASGAGATVVMPDSSVLRVGGFVGFVDEVRVSTVARYTVSFTPAKRLTGDADTLLLDHLDMAATALATHGSATFVSDSSYSGGLCQ